MINTLNNDNNTHFTYFTQNKESFVPNVDFFNNSDDMEFINKQISSMELGLKNLETILVNHIGCEGLQNALHFFNYVYLIGVYLQIDLDRSFDIVHSSNMSKVCNSQEEAEKTKEWYLNNEKRYDSPTVFESTKFKGKYLVRNASTGKALKNINYTLSLSLFINASSITFFFYYNIINYEIHLYCNHFSYFISNFTFKK